MIGIKIEDLTGKNHIYMSTLKEMNVERLLNLKLKSYLYVIVLHIM